MSKKKKRMEEFDISADEQKDILDAINNVIDGKADAKALLQYDVGLSECDEIPGDAADFLTGLVNERLGISEPEDDKMEKSKENKNGSDDTIKKYQIEDSIDNPEVSDTEMCPHDGLKAFTVRKSDNEFRLVHFSDGIREMTIDINSLYRDSEEILDIEDFINEIYGMALIRLSEILPNFYPTAIMSKAMMDDRFNHITEFDDDKFNFFEYPDGTNNLMLGYYIPEKSIEIYGDIIDELIEDKKVFSFLNALEEISSTPGISFSDIPGNYVNELMLLDRFNESTTTFIERLRNDEYTTFDDKDETPFSRFALPFQFNNKSIDDYIVRMAFGNDSDCDNTTELNLFEPIDDSGEDEVTEPGNNMTVDLVTPPFIKPNVTSVDSVRNDSYASQTKTVTEDVVEEKIEASQTTEIVYSTENSENYFEPDEDSSDLLDDIDVDEVDDPEETEAIYFGSKKSDNFNNKSTKMPSKDLDEDFVVKRQK